VPDEEMGSQWGMNWLCENRPDLVDVEFELSEGGAGASRFAGKQAKLFNVATNEKLGAGLRLTAVGKPGHGSRPHEDNSAIHLMRALLKLHEWDRGITYTPDTLGYLQRLAEAGLMPPLDQRDEVEAQIRRSPQMYAAFVNTLNVTVVNSGIKSNVIPAKSEAIIDCRILPGESREAWKQAVSDYVDDPRITVEFARNVPVPPNVAAEWDTELFRAINAVIHESMEDAVVVPGMTVGATDNRFLRARGIPAYGFIPCLLSPEESAGFHGNNEFLTVDNLNMGIELMYEIVRRMCT
ncbi:MAG: M20/M25/M40 family metallo-hydrolase, partial [Tepidiformaceae bacterium]